MLKFYTLDNNYIIYLKNYDSLVMSNYNKDIERPYVGLLFEINNMNYYAPMTSPKKKHEKMNNSIDFEKIEKGKFGAINFNNMIPVTDNALNFIDINKIEDEQYRSLLDNQFRWVNKNENKLIKKAKKLYDLFNDNKLNDFVKQRCCNFSLLEEKCKIYDEKYKSNTDNEQNIYSNNVKETKKKIYKSTVKPRNQKINDELNHNKKNNKKKSNKNSKDDNDIPK